jgi:uncharacterized protein (DUF1697 family)
MKIFIALFRGINVGGSGVLPMRDLVEALEALGLKDVKTYIQSGNVVFKSSEEDSAKISSRISAQVGKSFDFEPEVLVLEPAEIQRALDANPFPEAQSQPKTLCGIVDRGTTDQPRNRNSPVAPAVSRVRSCV